ncbi:hypothetical protein Tco_0917547, partial [Tanacetum coccineum]
QHLHCILLKNTSDWVISNSFPKGEKYEVFGMPIPNELILNNIRNALYYSAYLEIVTKHDQKITAEQSGKKKPATAKQPKLKPASKPAPAPEPKLVDEPDEEPAQPKPEPEAEHQGDEPVAEATRPLPVVKGKGKAIVTDEQVAQSLLALHTTKRRSTTYQFIFQRRTLATEEASTRPSAQPQDDTSGNIIIQFGDEQGNDVANVVNLEERTAKIDEDQAGSDPGKTLESRPPPE